jgi:Flp pilus assembly protein CpaB
MVLATGEMANDGAVARVVAPRRGLPSGRAVVGGFLVAIAALGTFSAYRGASSGASHRYVVAAHDIAAGTTVQASDLVTTTVDLPDGLAQRAFSQPAAVAGHIALFAVAKDELVQASALADASKAAHRYELSLPIERTRALGGTLVAGELVDVLVTYGSGSDAATLVVARRASVVHIDDAKRSSSVGSTGDLSLELALTTPDEVLAVTHASQAGNVTIVRATGAAAAGAAPGPDEYQPPAGAGGG